MYEQKQRLGPWVSSLEEDYKEELLLFITSRHIINGYLGLTLENSRLLPLTCQMFYVCSPEYESHHGVMSAYCDQVEQGVVTDIVGGSVRIT